MSAGAKIAFLVSASAALVYGLFTYSARHGGGLELVVIPLLYIYGAHLVYGFASNGSMYNHGFNLERHVGKSAARITLFVCGLSLVLITLYKMYA